MRNDITIIVSCIQLKEINHLNETLFLQYSKLLTLNITSTVTILLLQNVQKNPIFHFKEQFNVFSSYQPNKLLGQSKLIFKITLKIFHFSFSNLKIHKYFPFFVKCASLRNKQSLKIILVIAEVKKRQKKAIEYSCIGLNGILGNI